jgi:hypothetical protein
MKFEFISQFPVSRGTIIRDPAGVVLFCGGKEKIRPGFSIAAASRCRFAPAMAMTGATEKKGCHSHGFSLFSTPMAPCGAKGQIGFAPFITGQKQTNNIGGTDEV